MTPNTPYIIMFGPDRCGSTDKVHFIVRWRNPVTDVWEEKHLTNAPRPVNDKLSHLYTLVVRADGSFTIKVDNEDVRSGSLAAPEDFSPSVLPPAEIDDATDVKPADWVDAAQIPDPDATKPDDWDEDAPSTIEDASAVKPAGWLDDEPAFVSDPSAHRPEEWDDEEDGALPEGCQHPTSCPQSAPPPPSLPGIWEPPTVENPKCSSAPGCGEWRRPLIANPAYKGRWHAPLIANPAYKGPWAPRKVANPAFFEDKHVGRLGGATIGAVGVEVWTMSGGITYDGFLVSRDEKAAEAFGASSWKPKHAAQSAAAAAEKQAKEHEARLTAAETGGWAEKAVYWLGEATALAKSQPAATAATAVALLATLLALVFFGCSGSPASPPPPPIFEPEDERAASAAARREMRAEAAAAAPAEAAPAAPAAAAAAETLATDAPDAAGDDDAAPAPSSGKSAGSRKAKAAAAASAASEESPASSGSPSGLRRSTRSRQA